MVKNLYTPSPDDSERMLQGKAYNCGYRLHPTDPRAKWLDDPSKTRFVGAYHAGQAAAFEEGG